MIILNLIAGIINILLFYDSLSAEKDEHFRRGLGAVNLF